ncbi:MAG: ribbon-helix-helix protein, CopG family [Planctomycetota bacterium]
MKHKPEEKGMSETLVVRVPTELRAALEKAAEADRRGLSDFLRIALSDYLATREGGSGAQRKGGKA